MSKNMLRAPLIKSAVLLAVFSVIIYLAASSQEGSVWGALGAIFIAVFRAAQLGVGLVLALLLCLIVLVGIFLGCVAVLSIDSASGMYHQLRSVVAENLSFVTQLFQKDDPRKIDQSPDKISPPLRQEISMLIESSLEAIRNAQDAASENLSVLHGRINSLEQEERFTALPDNFHNQEKMIEELLSRISQLEKTALELVRRFDELEKLEKVQTAALSENLLERITALEKVKDSSNDVARSLEGKIKALQGEIADLAAAKRAEAKEIHEEHRLFSYLENENDKQKLEQAVTEALENDMTYAQVADLLAEKTGKAVSDVVSAHPSLVKDYIRQCRKNK